MSEYDENSEINQTAYSALVLNKTVCAGYAKAFQYIMIELGIPTYYVSGEAQGDHAWNIVKLDDEYYNVDLTWGDQEVIIYNFFNVSDEILNKTHTRSEISKLLPICNGKEYSNLEKTYDIVIGNEDVNEEDSSGDDEVYDENLLGILRGLVDNGENFQN